MMKITFIVFVACVTQVFSHHCGTMETCMKNVSNLETQASNFINNFLDKHEANLTRLHTVFHTKYQDFSKAANGGLAVCKSYANSFQQKLSDSCGILPLTDDSAISDEKAYIELLSIDFQNTSNSKEKAEMCPHLVKYYNFVCDRIVYDVDTYLSCDIDAKVNDVFEGPWKHCIHTFQHHSSNDKASGRKYMGGYKHKKNKKQDDYIKLQINNILKLCADQTDKFLNDCVNQSFDYEGEDE